MRGPIHGPVSPAANSRSVSDHASALFGTPRSSAIGPIRKEKTTALSGDTATLIASAVPTITQP